jgi:hypothetical protein
MRTKLFTAASLFVFAATSGAFAQQTSEQDNRSDAAQADQTAAAGRASSGAAPEQAGDLYQQKSRSTGDFGAPSPNEEGSSLPGALTVGTDPLGNAGAPEPKE